MSRTPPEYLVSRSCGRSISGNVLCRQEPEDEDEEEDEDDKHDADDDEPDDEGYSE